MNSLQIIPFSLPHQIRNSPSKTEKRVQIRTLKSNLIQVTFFCCISMLSRIVRDTVCLKAIPKEKKKKSKVTPTQQALLLNS